MNGKLEKARHAYFRIKAPEPLREKIKNACETQEKKGIRLDKALKGITVVAAASILLIILSVSQLFLKDDLTVQTKSGKVLSEQTLSVSMEEVTYPQDSIGILSTKSKTMITVQAVPFTITQKNAITIDASAGFLLIADQDQEYVCVEPPHLVYGPLTFYWLPPDPFESCETLTLSSDTDSILITMTCKSDGIISVRANRKEK